MLKKVHILCQECQARKLYKVETLLPRIGRRAKFKCDNCAQIFTVEITADLLKEYILVNDNSNSNYQHTSISLKSNTDWSNNKIKKLAFRFENNNEKMIVQLVEGLNEIGRNPAMMNNENPIKVDTTDEFISRSHCILEVVKFKSGFKYKLWDNESKNKTIVKQELKVKILEPEDIVFMNKSTQVFIGKTTFCLE